MDLHGAGDLGYKKNMNVTDRTSAPWLCDWQPDADTPPLADTEIRVLRDELALIAVCMERELGVDLEKIRSISESARIVESYFTPAELAQFMALDPSRRDEAFLRGWTRKEAILKAKGVGLAGLATAFETM